MDPMGIYPRIKKNAPKSSDSTTLRSRKQLVGAQVAVVRKGQVVCSVAHGMHLGVTRAGKGTEIRSCQMNTFNRKLDLHLLVISMFFFVVRG